METVVAQFSARLAGRLDSAEDKYIRISQPDTRKNDTSTISMDPLSVTASVVGLLGAVAKVYSLLEFISSAKNAPSTIQDARIEVKHVEIALRSLQRFFSQLESVSTQRKELIFLDELLVSLADAMMALSDFENILEVLANMTKTRTTIFWFRYSKQIDEHIAKTQRYKTSLTMMLNIMQCESDLEASQSQERLQILVEEILVDNQRLKGKMRQLEDSFDARSTFTRDNDTLRPMAESICDDVSTIAGVRRTNTIQSLRASVLGFAFESILKQSRVYKKSERNVECDCSFVSSAMRSHAWSVFSGYSLADISVLSVIAMPITPLDITNGTYYGIKAVRPAAWEQARVLYDFVGQNDNELAVKAGDVIDIVRKEDQGWIVAKNNLGQGLVPAAYVEEIAYERTPISEPGTRDIMNSRPSSPATVVSATNLDDNSDNSTTSTGETVDSSLPEEDDFENWNINYDEDFPCKGCGELLVEGKAFELAGNRWHLDCFRCNTCGIQLDSDANLLLLGDGSLICNNCTYACSACGNKIEDLAILTGDEAFCATCFRCRNCKRKIENLRYARTSQGIFCMSCHGLLMEHRRRKGLTIPKPPHDIVVQVDPPLKKPEKVHHISQLFGVLPEELGVEIEEGSDGGEEGDRRGDEAEDELLSEIDHENSSLEQDSIEMQKMDKGKGIATTADFAKWEAEEAMFSAAPSHYDEASMQVA